MLTILRFSFLRQIILCRRKVKEERKRKLPGGREGGKDKWQLWIQTDKRSVTKPEEASVPMAGVSRHPGTTLAMLASRETWGLGHVREKYWLQAPTLDLRDWQGKGQAGGAPRGLGFSGLGS